MVTGMPVAPYSGSLKELIVSEEETHSLLEKLQEVPSLTLSPYQQCDLELLINGACSPLSAYMNQKDYNSVIENECLSDGTPWPIPMTLDIDEAKIPKKGGKLILRDLEGLPLAILQVEDFWKPDLEKEALAVYGTTKVEHPGVKQLKQRKEFYISGSLQGLHYPSHQNFLSYRQSPAELRKFFSDNKKTNVIALHCQKPLHNGHYQWTQKALKDTNGHLLLHPPIGYLDESDQELFSRIRICQSMLSLYPKEQASLSILPLVQRYAGPKEAFWQAIIRQNYGCDYFIVDEYHSSPVQNGQYFYPAQAAAQHIKKYSKDLKIQAIECRELVYVPEKREYISKQEAPENTEYFHVSNQALQAYLEQGKRIPEWLVQPVAEKELRKCYPLPSEQGLTIFFTGLSGSGKSTLAKRLYSLFLEETEKKVTILDGDLVRRCLSEGLGFTKIDRDRNVMRVAYVASEITKHKGVAICPVIAPYDEARKHARELVKKHGNFILVHLSTPLSECELRDPKGLYMQARQGKIEHFTGVSDPYEAPHDADLVIDTARESVEESSQRLWKYLQDHQYIEIPSVTEKLRSVSVQSIIQNRGKPASIPRPFWSKSSSYLYYFQVAFARVCFGPSYTLQVFRVTSL